MTRYGCIGMHPWTRGLFKAYIELANRIIFRERDL